MTPNIMMTSRPLDEVDNTHHQGHLATKVTIAVALPTNETSTQESISKLATCMVFVLK